MMKKIIFLFVLATLVNSCGFKTISQDRPAIYLQNVNVVGDNRIAYAVKNNILLISTKGSKDKYNVAVSIKTNKYNKIKDNTGKITRYELRISADLTLKNLDTEKVSTRSFIKSTDYDIALIHSDTINNEMLASKNIVQQISDEITNYIVFTTNK